MEVENLVRSIIAAKLPYLLAEGFDTALIAGVTGLSQRTIKALKKA